jgi:CrcB protein
VNSLQRRQSEIATPDGVDPELRSGAPRPSPTAVAAAFCGGSLGTIARYAFDLAWPEPDGSIPHTTNVINTSGAFLIGIVATILTRLAPDRRTLRAFVVTGLLGGWTTMSALAVDGARVGVRNGVVTATIAMALSFTAGVIATAAGIVLEGRVARRRAAHQ